MKKPLFLVLATLVSFSAFADQASKDPVVNALRSQFTDARAPRPEDLKFGRSWTCTYHSAISGSHSSTFAPGYYQFERSTNPAEVNNARDFIAPVFKYADKSLHGQYSNKRKAFGSDQVRVDSKGGLIVEFAQESCSGFECVALLFTDRSEENFLAAVVGYRHCEVE